jgi:hypothetical protein
MRVLCWHGRGGDCEMYKKFRDKRDGVTKVLLRPAT